MITPTALPAWLPLLRKPCEDILGSRTAWDLALPDGTPVHVTRSGQGLQNLLYRVEVRGQVYACNLFVADERRRAERAWAALSALQASGLALAPAPIAFAPDGPLPQPAIACGWLEGRPLAEQPVDPPALALLLHDLACIHRARPAAGLDFLPAFHAPDGYAPYLAEACGLLEQAQGCVGAPGGRSAGLPGPAADLPELLPLVWQALGDAERLAMAAPGGSGDAGDGSGRCPLPGLIRADGDPGSIVWLADGRLAFLNWENSGWGDPAYDLAELRWHPRFLGRVPQAGWDAALAAYPAPPQDPGFSARLAVYNRLLPAWWLARSAVHLLEGAGLLGARPRLARVPARFYRGVRAQIDRYLAALGLIALPPDEDDGDEA